MSKRDALMGSIGASGSRPVGLPAGMSGLTAVAKPAQLEGTTREKAALRIAVNRIVRDDSQPREEFDEDALNRLAESLKARGQLQPISVRWDEGRGMYVVLAGERRWRAASMAGLAELSCIVYDRPIDDGERLAIQVVENALRDDLKPVESARAYRRLIDLKGWTTRELAAELHVSQPTVVRALALLDLPESVQEQVEQGAIAPHVAYEVSKLDDATAQAEVAQAVVREGLKRDEVTELVSAIKAKRPAPATRPEPITIDVGEGVTVKVAWKKACAIDIAKALRLAAKQVQAQAVKDEAA